MVLGTWVVVGLLEGADEMRLGLLALTFHLISWKPTLPSITQDQDAYAFNPCLTSLSMLFLIIISLYLEPTLPT
jgi:hypothetical protein